MDLDSGAGLLHRLTSYTPSRPWDTPVDDPRVRHDLVPNDPSAFRHRADTAASRATAILSSLPTTEESRCLSEPFARLRPSPPAC